MVRTGFAPAPLDDLAARVVRLLPAEMGGERYPGWSWDQDAPFPDEPWDDSVPAFSPDDPFGGGFEAVSSAPSAKQSPARAELDADEGGGTPVEDEEAPVPEEETEEEPEVAFAVRGETPKPPRGGKLAAFLLFIAIAGGVYFFSQTKRPAPPSTMPPGPSSGGESSPFPAPSAPPGKDSAPVTSAPTPALPAAPRPGPAPAPSPAPPVPAASPGSSVPESHGAAMISPDWAGHPAAFMIHFSSYQKKENADRDAARLTKLLGRPLRVIGVNLGASGYWYRVMLGEFRSREEADAAREELVAKGTPGMGLIYQVSAFPADRVSESPSDKISPPPAG